MNKFIPKEYLENHIRLALSEDVGEGDYSSISSIDANANYNAEVVAKEDGVVCGLEVASKVFEMVDNTIATTCLIKDGDRMKKGDLIMKLSGPAISILTGERTALNYLQRLSGIATNTSRYVERISGTEARLLDTRKTTPGLRLFEKYAVRMGGGHNHRIGLWDMIMLKDNHIDYAGGIEKAIERANNYIKEKDLEIKIEIEVRDFEELDRVIAYGGVDRIMLDNFTPEELRRAVEIINGRFETESSGGITYDTILEFAQTGVDYISVGALTHNIKSLDISLIASL